jgi:excinuclease ABC subunit A
MSKSPARPVIRLRGVRHNNLKNFDLDLPLAQLIVVTGLSGSGKSSLAFDTLYAEGQRRYIETFSPYARQFFDRMDKPQVDSIEGIPPAIAIEQRNAVRTTRSTVGTMTEICDYLKLLWPQLAQLHCRQCGKPVKKESPQTIWSVVRTNLQPPAQTTDQSRSAELLVTFDLPLTEKLSLADSLGLIAKQGYQRLLYQGDIVRLEEMASRVEGQRLRLAAITVVQDRLKAGGENRARFVEACEQAYHFGKGKLSVHSLDPAARAQATPHVFSNRLHCAGCDLEYRDPTSALFSFNHPLGACPACRGFGRVINIDYDLALPDRSKTLAGGVVRPWQTGVSADCQRDLLRMCRHYEIPTDVPFQDLPQKWQDFVIQGEPGYGTDEEHEWPRAWYGIKGYFRWLESRAYKMHVRVLLSRYRTYTQCPACQGQRLQPEALLYRWHPQGPQLGSDLKGAFRDAQSLNLADFYALSVRDALRAIEACAAAVTAKKNDALRLALEEVRCRLSYLAAVGLGYLSLDRPTRSLSGGETERVNLTTCLGSRLVNALFVLDEPSVGLHPRDTERLVTILQRLRDAGNTVVVVEHEASVMRAADQIVDLGPGHGSTGGQVVFQGSYGQILRHKSSLTGQYLSGRKRVELPPVRPVVLRDSSPPVSGPADSRREGPVLREARVPYGKTTISCGTLKLSGATKHNLKNFSVEIPLARLVCVTGVSGSGKTTLVREVLLPALAGRFQTRLPGQRASDRLSPGLDSDESDDPSPGGQGAGLARLEGAEALGGVVLVDQSILGKTPRSNPAVYIGAFDDIRELFAQSEAARQRGLNASAFSFNSSQGQCERCRGAGFEKIEMQFLSDVFIRCPDCNGRRYREHILQVRIKPIHQGRHQAGISPKSVADLLDSTIEDTIQFLCAFGESRPAQRAVRSLKYLAEVGLGYLKLGQPINTLSGGESQRLKLVRHLADSDLEPGGAHAAPGSLPDAPTIFLFDEPTTGLHFDDVRVLLQVFQRLVNQGHSVLVVEHNLDVIKYADWVIDLGPEAGDQGGTLVAAGTPAQIAICPESHTGRALRGVLRPPTPTARRRGLAPANNLLEATPYAL